ncbi:MAG TPA: tetratricopeptide repeat protein [Woeseiaceae bacterium]
MSLRIDSLLSMLDKRQDSALLRFSLGNEYSGLQDWDAAILHLQRACELDPDYSAAWKLLGKAQAASGNTAAAQAAFATGAEVAKRNGDEQAAREMAVFLRRLRVDH